MKHVAPQPVSVTLLRKSLRDVTQLDEVMLV